MYTAPPVPISTHPIASLWMKNQEECGKRTSVVLNSVVFNLSTICHSFTLYNIYTLCKRLPQHEFWLFRLFSLIKHWAGHTLEINAFLTAALKILFYFLVIWNGTRQ